MLAVTGGPGCVPEVLDEVGVEFVVGRVNCGPVEGSMPAVVGEFLSLGEREPSRLVPHPQEALSESVS